MKLQKLIAEGFLIFITNINDDLKEKFNYQE